MSFRGVDWKWVLFRFLFSPFVCGIFRDCFKVGTGFGSLMKRRVVHYLCVD
uniref:Uncharacterized protein n=1 Tax=Rhizophora mucronata TaxID=61149 RepID=A0A2P2R5A5_RHIMU